MGCWGCTVRPTKGGIMSERQRCPDFSDYLNPDNKDWCPVCGETIDECECTDEDFYEVYGDC